MVGGALLGLFGAIIIAASIATTVSSFGATTPLALLGLEIGASLIGAGLGISAGVVGCGIIGAGVFGLFRQTKSQKLATVMEGFSKITNSLVPPIVP
jgi:hypothetical protein